MLTHHRTIKRKLIFQAIDFVLGSNSYIYRRNPLTDLPGREAFDHVLENESDYVIIFVDLDNLKQINAVDYKEGDKAIKVVGHAIEDNLRSNDLVTHWGGDEFAVVIREVSLPTAKLIAQRILASVNLKGYEASLGLGPDEESAQAATNEAKTLGKNQVAT